MSLSPRYRRDQEVFTLLRVRRVFLHLLLASQLATSQGMEVDDVCDEAPLLWKQAIVPLNKREFDRRQ